MTYSVLAEEQSCDYFDDVLVRKQLSAISTSAATGTGYPSVGEHCGTCLSSECKEVFIHG